MSCCRRRAFSVISSARERVRSAMKPLPTPEGRKASRSALIARAARPAIIAGSCEGTRSTARSERIRTQSSRLVPRRILSDRAAEEGSSQDRGPGSGAPWTGSTWSAFSNEGTVRPRFDRPMGVPLTPRAFLAGDRVSVSYPHYSGRRRYGTAPPGRAGGLPTVLALADSVQVGVPTVPRTRTVERPTRHRADIVNERLGEVLGGKGEHCHE